MKDFQIIKGSYKLILRIKDQFLKLEKESLDYHTRLYKQLGYVRHDFKTKVHNQFDSNFYKDKKFYLLVKGEELIGYGVLDYKLYFSRPFLLDFIVTKKYRGQGLGQKLLTYILANESRPFLLTVVSNNPVKYLYYKMGFNVLLYSMTNLKPIKQELPENCFMKKVDGRNKSLLDKFEVEKYLVKPTVIRAQKQLGKIVGSRFMSIFKDYRSGNGILLVKNSVPVCYVVQKKSNLGFIYHMNSSPREIGIFLRRISRSFIDKFRIPKEDVFLTTITRESKLVPVDEILYLV